jgi:hypothetical protein
MNPHRNTAHATTRERLAGFTEPETMHELAPGLVAVSRSAADSDAEFLDDLIRWLGTTGATVAGPFATLQLAAASQRLAA